MNAKWQIDGTFEGALAALKAGRRVRNRNWNGKGMYLEAQFPDEHSKMTQPYIYIRTVSGDLVPWLASQQDLFSEAWEIADDYDIVVYGLIDTD